MIKVKKAVEVLLAVSILIGFSSPIFCQTIKMSITITEVTGLLRVTKPDGTKMDILPSDVPVQIPADCKIETIEGTAKIEVRRLKQVAARRYKITADKGDIDFSFEKEKTTLPESKSYYAISRSELLLTVFLTPRSSAKILFDKSTGKILVRGLKGIVKVFVKGGVATLEPGKELAVGWSVPEHIPSIRTEPPEPEPIEGSPYLP